MNKCRERREGEGEGSDVNKWREGGREGVM